MKAINKQTVLIGFVLISMFYFNACKKEETPIKQQTDSITANGIVYKTVKIGTQWWMAEDLKVKKYRNGDPIDSVNVNFDAGKKQWDTTKAGSYFQQGTIFLYNWYAIGDSRNIAPAGWHMPTDDEWKQLEMSQGMSQTDADKVNFRGTNQGNKLKTNLGWTGVSESDQFKIYGTNESGFSARANGAVMLVNIDNQIKNPEVSKTGFWWTATVEQDSMAWYRYMDYNKANVFRYYGSKHYGFSVRCVKDK